MRFEKWQALGNDYVIVERGQLAFELTPARVRALCRDHTGVSADGVLLLSPPADGANVADLRIFNPDGSEAELSGNGAREAILYVRRRGWTDRDSFRLHTPAGPIHARIDGPFSCRVLVGTARLHSRDYPSGKPDGSGELRIAPTQPASGDAERARPAEHASSEGRVWRFRHVSIGNPQCAIELDSLAELEALNLAEVGPPIERHPAFPNRTNVSWYAEQSPPPQARIRARIFERGVGETLSSGTGASGAAVAYLVGRRERRGGLRERAGVTVELDGGELEVEVDTGLDVTLSGWAKPVYEGRLSDVFVQELAAAA
jgi:diaminopimelate epimerase